MTIELPDEGANGFAIPPDEILPICEETLEGIISLCNPKGKNVTEVKRISSAQTCKIMDQIVVLVNLVLFIIAHCD